MIIRLKALNYFEVQALWNNTSNYIYFEWDNSQIPFELVELRINRVRINHAF